MLSILIPVYNHNCALLVQDLHAQGVALDITFEILVLDDTSTQCKEENRVINELEFAQYIESSEHFGRAKIRNELAQRAQYSALLFIDSDALVDTPDFVQKYVDNLDKAEVIIGGMKYSKQPPKENALRWYYGSLREHIPAKKRNLKPYSSLISFNILIAKSVFEKYPFDESTIDPQKSGYGHEDTLLGLKFRKHNVSVLHIDNQLIHDYQETNEGFLNNSLIAVEKYVFNPQFREREVVAQIKIFRVFEKVKALGMNGLLAFFYQRFGQTIKKQLLRPAPSLRLFDLYRLGYLADFYKKKQKLK